MYGHFWNAVELRRQSGPQINLGFEGIDAEFSGVCTGDLGIPLISVRKRCRKTT